MVLFGGHANEVFALAGDTLLVCATATGLVRYRKAGWWLLCIWASLHLLASAIEALIAFDYIALSRAQVWIELRPWSRLIAWISLVLGLSQLAFRRRPLQPTI